MNTLLLLKQVKLQVRFFSESMVDYDISSDKLRFKCQVTKPLSNGLWDTNGK